MAFWDTLSLIFASVHGLISTYSSVLLACVIFPPFFGVVWLMGEGGDLFISISHATNPAH